MRSAHDGRAMEGMVLCVAGQFRDMQAAMRSVQEMMMMMMMMMIMMMMMDSEDEDEDDDEDCDDDDDGLPRRRRLVEQVRIQRELFRALMLRNGC